MRSLYLGNCSYRNAYGEVMVGYELGTDSRSWDSRSGFPDPLIGFCPKEFVEFTNVKLKPGELMKVESINFKLTPIKRANK